MSMRDVLLGLFGCLVLWVMALGWRSLSASIQLSRMLSKRHSDVWFNLPEADAWYQPGLPVRRFIYSELGRNFHDPEVRVLVERVRRNERVSIYLALIGMALLAGHYWSAG